VLRFSISDSSRGEIGTPFLNFKLAELFI
jgi:hypothetical protein